MVREQSRVIVEGIVQTTLKSPVTFSGKGLHTGQTATVVVRPAAANFGIWFRRKDIDVGDSLIRASWDSVKEAELCTKISNGSGASVMTIEHLMAAIAGTGLSNALIEIDGPEVPALDGSSAEFVAGIVARGFVEQHAPVFALKVLRPVGVRRGEATAILEPAEAFEIDFRINFSDAAIGHQHLALNMANGAFVRELCDSRTFCRTSDIDVMQSKGRALGGEPGRNAVVFGAEKVESPGGLRHDDEPVRHKMLDAMGDLALAGAPLIARYRGNRSGHAMTNALLRALFADPDAFELVECSTRMAKRLPGVGVTSSDIPAVA